MLQKLVNQKLNQWSREALISAARAFQNGDTAELVIYPTGKRMMRFAEPFTKYGMHYEVTESEWEYVSQNNGIIEG